jgi:hypothetical protein
MNLVKLIAALNCFLVCRAKFRDVGIESVTLATTTESLITEGVETEELRPTETKGFDEEVLPTEIVEEAPISELVPFDNCPSEPQTPFNNDTVFSFIPNDIAVDYQICGENQCLQTSVGSFKVYVLGCTNCTDKAGIYIHNQVFSEKFLNDTNIPLDESVSFSAKACDASGKMGIAISRILVIPISALPDAGSIGTIPDVETPQPIQIVHDPDQEKSQITGSTKPTFGEALGANQNKPSNATSTTLAAPGSTPPSSSYGLEHWWGTVFISILIALN